jgi:hypothetical protein
MLELRVASAVSGQPGQITNPGQNLVKVLRAVVAAFGVALYVFEVYGADNTAVDLDLSCLRVGASSVGKYDRADLVSKSPASF